MVRRVLNIPLPTFYSQHIKLDEMKIKNFGGVFSGVLKVGLK
jgi:hypothetical protein